MDRRAFLKTTAAAAGVALLEGCARREVQYLEQRVSKGETLPGESLWKSGVCGQCAAGCGTRVRTVDGLAKKLEGAIDSPVNRGGLCALGQAAVQSLYHPDRVTVPHRRDGGTLTETTWEEALAAAAAAIAAARERDPRRVVLVTGRRLGPLSALGRRLARELGAEEPVVVEPPGRAAERAAAGIVLGIDGLPVYDLGQSDYVLSIGAPLLDAWGSPVHQSAAFAHARRGRPGRRAKLVFAGPRMGLTAAAADEWLPVVPGTEGLLARALAGVLLAEGLATPGGEAAYRTLYPGPAPAVDDAARACDLPAARIYRLARELAAAEQGVVVAGGSAGEHPDGVAQVAAALALNHMVGSPGRTGGVSAPATFGVSRRIEGERSAAAPAVGLCDLSRRLSGEAESPVEVLLVVEADPFHALPALAERLAGMPAERRPAVYSLASFLDDTAAAADLVLPVQADLERWRMTEPEVPVGPAVLGLARPVVAPRGECRHPGDVLLALAAAGGTPLPWSSWIQLMETTLEQEMASLPGGADADFWSWYEPALDRGGLWHEVAPRAELPEPSRPAAEPVPPPAYDPGEPAGEGFRLVPFASVKSGGAHLPWLQQLPDPLSTVMWGSWAEVSSTDARRLGIATGDRLTLTTSGGSIEVPAVVSPAVRPGTVAVPLGQGYRDLGRWARGRGVNPRLLLDGRQVEGTGEPASGHLRVRLARAGRGSIALYGAGLRQAEDLPYGRPLRQAGPEAREQTA